MYLAFPFSRRLVHVAYSIDLVILLQHTTVGALLRVENFALC